MRHGGSLGQGAEHTNPRGRPGRRGCVCFIPDLPGVQGVGLSRLGELVLGDVITAVNKTPVSTTDELQAVLDPLKPGDRITLTVERAGKTRDVPLALIEVE